MFIYRVSWIDKSGNVGTFPYRAREKQLALDYFEGKKKDEKTLFAVLFEDYALIAEYRAP